MKTLNIIIALIFIFQTSIAISQKEKTNINSKKFEIEVKDAENSHVKLVNLAGDLIVTSNNSTKIIIEATGKIKKPKRAEGLKRIGAGGEDNTEIGLNFEKSGNNIILTGAVSMSTDIDYKISIPKNMKVYIELGMFNNGDLDISGFNSDLELDVKTSDIKLREVTGPTVISSLSGDIDIVFSKISQKGPFSIKAISGNIDVSLPSSTPADLHLSSISGGIYSDFDIKPTNNKSSNLTYIGGGSRVNSKLNNGGVKLSITAISGDIYLRKKK